MSGVFCPHTPFWRRRLQLQQDTRKAIRKARRKRMSLRAIGRESAIHRASIKKYMDSDGPPGRRTLPGFTASTSDTVAP